MRTDGEEADSRAEVSSLGERKETAAPSAELRGQEKKVIPAETLRVHFGTGWN